MASSTGSPAPAAPQIFMRNVEKPHAKIGRLVIDRDFCVQPPAAPSALKAKNGQAGSSASEPASAMPPASLARSGPGDRSGRAGLARLTRHDQAWLPGQIEFSLEAHIHSTCRGMDVGGVAGDEHAPNRNQQHKQNCASSWRYQRRRVEREPGGRPGQGKGCDAPLSSRPQFRNGRRASRSARWPGCGVCVGQSGFQLAGSHIVVFSLPLPLPSPFAPVPGMATCPAGILQDDALIHGRRSSMTCTRISR